MFKKINFLFKVIVNYLAIIKCYIFMTNKNNNLMPSKEIKEPYKCSNCYIIRLFLLAVVFIVLLALIQSDKLHYLDFVTPSNAATLIVFLGVIMFLVKLSKYVFEKKKH